MKQIRSERIMSRLTPELKKELEEYSFEEGETVSLTVYKVIKNFMRGIHVGTSKKEK